MSQPEDPRKAQFPGLEKKGLGSSLHPLANDPLTLPGPHLSCPQFPSLRDVGVSQPVCRSAQLHSLRLCPQKPGLGEAPGHRGPGGQVAGGVSWSQGHGRARQRAGAMSSTGLRGVTSVHSPGSLMDGLDKDLIVMVRGAGLSGRVVAARPLVLTLQELLSLTLSSPRESQQVSQGCPERFKLSLGQGPGLCLYQQSPQGNSDYYSSCGQTAQSPWSIAWLGLAS